MAAVPRIGPPRAGTVVAADLGPSLAAYRDHLDLQVISDAPLTAALAVGGVVSALPPPEVWVTQMGADHRILPSSCVTFA